MTLYLEAADFVDTATGAIRRTHLAVDTGPGGATTPVAAIPPGATRLDCRNTVVTRSFAIAHHHIYSALARGMPPVSPAPRNFVEILERIWWNLDRQLDADMIRACALATAIDAAKAGVTTILDHHSSPGAVPGSLAAIAAALDRVGVGGVLCYELSDRDGDAALAQAFAETDHHLRDHQGLVGLHASFTVSDATLARAVELAERHHTGLHVHVAEADSDQEHCLRTHGQRVVSRLHGAGALRSPRTLLVHCLHLDAGERDLIAASPAWVVQNTESNQNNGVGRFDGSGLGERLLIGTDGMHSDALQATRAAFLAEPALGPAGALQRLRNTHRYLAEGGFAGDGDNDLVVLDYPAPTPIHPANWAGHLVYGLHRGHVRDVIRGGELIVRDRQTTRIDEREAMAFCREQAERLWQRL